MQISQDIATIAEKISETVDCEQIYLFGSHAYGTPNDDSDYDIFVIIPDGAIRPIEVMQKIYGALAKSKMLIPIDVLAITASNFQQRSKLHTLERKIAREGVLLYERH